VAGNNGNHDKTGHKDYRDESIASGSTDKDCINGKSNRRTVMDGNLSYAILRFVEIVYGDPALIGYKEQADVLLLEMEKVALRHMDNFVQGPDSQFVRVI